MKKLLCVIIMWLCAWIIYLQYPAINNDRPGVAIIPGIILTLSGLYFILLIIFSSEDGACD